MKLHWADTQPDWEVIPLENRTRLQQLAARTDGIITPGNMLSFMGLALVGVGLIAIYDHCFWRGLIIIGIGRICDILDGSIAEYTKTKSPVGEGVDATFDKIAAIGSLTIFAVQNIIPWPFALIIGVENLLTSILSLIAKQLGKPIHPVSSGKIGGAIEWAAFLAFILSATIHNVPTSHSLKACGYILAVAAIILNAVATWRYAQLLSAQHSHSPQR